MKIYSKLLTGILLVSMLISCSDDFLELPPIGSLTEDNISTVEGIENVINGAYDGVSANSSTIGILAIMGGSMRGGEGHRGYTRGERGYDKWNTYNITLSDDANSQNISGFYNNIYKCNMALQLIEASTELDEDQKKYYSSHARFLRGHYYFTLWANFRNIPWVDETTTDYRVPNTDEDGNYVDISDNIIADFQYAYDNLNSGASESPYLVNKWSAAVYLAKMYTYRGDYNDSRSDWEAADALYDLIMTDGTTTVGEKYALLDNYKDNFSTQHNSTESVWEYASTYNETYPTLGGTDWAFFFYPSWMSEAWSYDFLQPTQWYVDHYRVDENGLPYLDMYDGDNASSYTIPDGSESSLDDDDYVVDQTNPVDPRLDINVGRRGVDYNGWGIQPLSTWISESTGYYGFYRHKKYIIDPEQWEESAILVPAPFVGPPPEIRLDVPTPILTYRDVILMAAEVKARLGDLDGSRDLVNEIRNRIKNNTDGYAMERVGAAADQEAEYTGEFAANYSVEPYPATGYPFDSEANALKAILYERTLELGLEGMRFYDLVRFGEDQNEIQTYLSYETPLRSYLESADYASDGHEQLLPFPSSAISDSQKDGAYTLTQNPGY